MFKELFTAFLIVFAGSAACQTITISEELPLRNDFSYTILGWIGGDLLLFRDKGHEFYVQSFDGEMHLKWEREIYIGPRKADIIGIVSDVDKFHLVVGMREKGDYILQHRVYDSSITLTDTVTLDTMQNVFITPRYFISESEDKHKVLLFREINDGLDLVSYDLQSKTILWKNEFEFNGGNLHLDYSSTELDNDGNFYLVLEPDKFLQKVQQLEVFSSVNSTGEVLHETLELGDFQAYDFHTEYDNVFHHLIITGLYSDRSVSRAQGFYVFNYEPRGDNTMHILPFDEALLAEVTGKDVAAVRGLTDFNVQKVALRQDGGAVLIAELNKEFSRRSSLPIRRDNTSFSRGGWVDYYYEDLILFAVNPDGTEHWKKVLHKRQYSQDDEAIYSSFFLFKTPARLRFLFNDEIKQENTVGGYEVTGTGFVERKTVFNTDYQRLKLRFKDGLQVAYNECIVPSERNNRLNLVRIKYD
jgi:hypothetical protein